MGAAENMVFRLIHRTGHYRNAGGSHCLKAAVGQREGVVLHPRGPAQVTQYDHAHPASSPHLPGCLRPRGQSVHAADFPSNTMRLKVDRTRGDHYHSQIDISTVRY
jgi:hypothetical protein